MQDLFLKASVALSTAFFTRKSRLRSLRCNLQGDPWKKGSFCPWMVPACAGCHGLRNSKPPRQQEGLGWNRATARPTESRRQRQHMRFAARADSCFKGSQSPNKTCLGHIFHFLQDFGHWHWEVQWAVGLFYVQEKFQLLHWLSTAKQWCFFSAMGYKKVFYASIWRPVQKHFLQDY